MERIIPPLSPEPSESVLPYTNPYYWNGQMLGDKTGRPMDDSFVHPRYRAARQALRAFDEHHQQGGGLFALETFRSGDLIDPNAHPPGSMFILASEKLVGINVPTGLSDRDWSEVPVPPRPDTLEERRIREDGLIYIANSELGVVTSGDKRDSRQLTCMTAVPFIRSRTVRALLARRRMNVREEPIRVGEALKYRCDCPQVHNNELITRIPKAIMIAPGEVQKDKKPAFFWLGRLASQPNN